MMSCEGDFPSCWDESKLLGGSSLLDSSRLTLSALVELDDAIVAVADKGFPNTQGIYYYEVKIISLAIGGTMAIGLTTMHDGAQISYPGWNSGSFGLHSVGELFCGETSMEGGKRHSYSPPFSPQDTIGCGWNCKGEKGDIFFTLNGKLLGIAFTVELSNLVNNKLFPVVGIRSQGIKLMTNFGATSFLWQGHTVNSSSSSQDVAALSRSLQERSEWYSSFSPVLETPLKEIDEFLHSNELLHRATRVPRKLVMKALRKGRQKYFGSSGRKSDLLEEEEQSLLDNQTTDDEAENFTDEKRRGSVTDDAKSNDDNSIALAGSMAGSTTPPPAQSKVPFSASIKTHLEVAAADIASKVGAKLAEYMSPPPQADNSTRKMGAVAESIVTTLESTDIERLAQIAHELSKLENQMPAIADTIDGGDPELAEQVITQVEFHSRNLRQRLYNLICETKNDETLGDLLGLNDQLFALIEQNARYLDKAKSYWGQDFALATTISSLAKPPPLSDLEKPGSYGLCEGTADSVRELLFFLRSGDEQAQLNAARALSYLVRDYQRNAEIRQWSQIDACQGGGISTLVAVFTGPRASRNPKLLHAIATTLVAIASGSWVTMYPPSSINRSSSVGSAAASATFDKTCSNAMDPSIVADSFESELDVLVSACKVLLTQPCYCCEYPSWPSRPGSCAFTQREAALALANLCLVFHTRDKLFDQTDKSPSWAVELTKFSIPLLMHICNTTIPRGKKQTMDDEATFLPTKSSNSFLEQEEMFEKKIVWNESRQLATFALSLLAQYPQTHQLLLDGGVLVPIVRFLQKSDSELLLHSITTLYWLSSPNSLSPDQYVSAGYTAAEILTSGAIPALIAVANTFRKSQGGGQEELPSNIRCVLIACFASLSSLHPCRRALLGDGLNGLLALSRPCLRDAKRLLADDNGSSQSIDRIHFRKQSSGGSSSLDTSSSASSPPPAALNAASTAVRRRLSSSSQKLSIDETTDKAVAATEPLLLDVAVLEKEEAAVELRYLAHAFSNFCNIGSETELGVLLNKGIKSLLDMCLFGDDLVTLHSLRTLLELTEKGNDGCDMLELHGATRMILDVLRKCTPTRTPAKIRGGKMDEIRIDACLILGNVANASMMTRANVAQAGALEYAVNTLCRLYGLDFQNDSTTPSSLSLKGKKKSKLGKLPEDDTAAASRLKINIVEPVGNDIEVAHQAVRVIAGIAELVASSSTSSGTTSLVPFHVWQKVCSVFLAKMDIVLILTILLLGSPASVIQCEACRALCAITRCPVSNKFDIARLALPQLVQLAIGGPCFPDRQLQLNAETVLQGLGFIEGMRDVQLCGRDVNTMYTFFIMMMSLEVQRLMQAASLSATFSAWQLPTEKRTEQLLHTATLQSDLVRSISLFSTFNDDENAASAREDLLGCDDDDDDMLGRRQSLIDEASIQELFGFNSNEDLDGSLASSSSATSKEKKKEKLSFAEPKWLRRLVGCGLKSATLAYDSEEEEGVRVHGSFSPPTTFPSSTSASAVSMKSAVSLPNISSPNSPQPALLTKTSSFPSQGTHTSDPNKSSSFHLENAKLEVASYVDSLIDTTHQQQEQKHEHTPSFELKRKGLQKLKAGTRGLLRTIPASCRLSLEANFPSLIERRRMIMPTAYYFSQKDVISSVDCLVPRRNLAISLPSGKDLSFRFDRIVHKLMAYYSDPMADNAAEEGKVEQQQEDEAFHNWTLCVRDCKITAADFHDNLISFLLRCPAISSVTFASSAKVTSHQTSSLLYIKILQNLPSNIISLTFSNILSNEEIKQIANCIETRRLQGLAIRNHGKRLKLTDIYPLVKLLAPPGSFNTLTGKFTVENSASSVSPMYAHHLAQDGRTNRLRWIDLSGNDLRDTGCARIITAIALSFSFSSSATCLESLDLSDNGIGGYAKETIDALIGEKRSVGLLSPQGFGLKELHLSSNAIGVAAVARLFKFLTSTASSCSLRTLNLSKNRIVKNKEFDQCLTNYLTMFKRGATERLSEDDPVGIFELDLCDNDLGEEVGRELRFAVEESSIHYLGLDGNKRIREQDIQQVEKALLANRSKWIRGVLDRVEDDDDEEELLVDKSTANEEKRQQQQLQQQQRAEVVKKKHAVKLSLPESDGLDGVRPRLSVMFSIPLVGKDQSSNLLPVQSIDFERERELIWQAFVSASHDIDVSFGFATADRLRSEVTMRTTAVHYSGHGSPDNLLFEDSDFTGMVQALSVESLRKLVSGPGEVKGRCQFVFVSACHSEYAGKAFVQAGIPHVVCVKVDSKILDRAAQSFTRAFYLSLAIGDTVEVAFKIAQKAVDVSKQRHPLRQTGGEAQPQESSKFLLLPEDGDHNVSIFPNRKVVAIWPSSDSQVSRQYRSKIERRNRLWRGGHVPSDPEDFIGRRVDTYSVVAAVLTRRIVCLTGEVGIGKSCLATAAANYISQRRIFRDDMLFLRLEQVTKVKDLFNLLFERTIDESNKVDFASSSSREIREERLYEMLRLRKFILILDHCDELVSTQASKFSHLIGRLVDEIKGIRILLTSVNPLGRVPGYAVTTLTVNPLSARNSARLFVRFYSYNHGQIQAMFTAHLEESNSPPASTDGSYDILDALGQHQEIKALKGNPGIICDRAFVMKEEEYNTMVKQCQIVVRNICSVVLPP